MPRTITRIALVASAVATISSASHAGSTDPYFVSLERDLDRHGLPPGRFVAGNSERATFRAFRLYGMNASMARVLPVEAATSTHGFTEAARVAISGTPRKYWAVVFGAQVQQAVAGGDTVLVVAYLRSSGAADASQAKFRMTIKGGDKTQGFRGGAPGPKWKRFYLPVKFKTSVRSFKIEFFVGYKKQTVDIGGIAVINYGKKANPDDMPKTVFDYTYAGREADAPWRAKARERIERIRKGDLTVHVVDANGNAVSGARVSMRMKRHAFGWANTSHTDIISRDDHPETARIKEKFLENFNSITIATMKWPAWRGAWSKNHDADNTLEVIEWAAANGLPMHGHTPIWHQYGPMPFKEGRESKEEMRRRIKQWLREVLTHPGVRGRFESWDAINHPVGYSAVWEHVGQDICLEEMKLYRELDPKAKLVINEGGIMPMGQAGNKKFYGFLEYMLQHGAPLDGIGFMSHFGASTVTPPETVLERLDRYASLDDRYPGYDLHLEITEFDISVDRSDPKQVELQVDYMRDFLTAVFSHPDVISVTQWGFWAGRMWKPPAALYDEDWTLRPHGAMYRKLVFEDWWTNDDATTDATGACTTRGFLGSYDVTATYRGETVTRTLSLAKGGTTVDVRLPVTVKGASSAAAAVEPSEQPGTLSMPATRGTESTARPAAAPAGRDSSTTREPSTVVYAVGVALALAAAGVAVALARRAPARRSRR